MAEDRYLTLLDLLVGLDTDLDAEVESYPTTMPRYWRSGKFPLHECVDRPELPCPACEAAAATRFRRA
jgi:hypothetical protein